VRHWESVQLTPKPHHCNRKRPVLLTISAGIPAENSTVYRLWARIFFAINQRNKDPVWMMTPPPEFECWPRWLWARWLGGSVACWRVRLTFLEPDADSSSSSFSLLSTMDGSDLNERSCIALPTGRGLSVQLSSYLSLYLCTLMHDMPNRSFVIQYWTTNFQYYLICSIDCDL
jgi:hypothetical protein